MITITREQVICMLYCEPYNEIRATELLKDIEEINLGICYRDDPTSSIVLSVRSVDQNSYKNKRCQSKDTAKATKPAETKKRIKISNQAQLTDFLNNVYLSSCPENNELYEARSLPTNDIFSAVLQITNILDDKNVNGFSKWCSAKKINFMKAAVKRKMNQDGQPITTRLLHVLKDEFIDVVLEDIVKHVPRYQ